LEVTVSDCGIIDLRLLTISAVSAGKKENDCETDYERNDGAQSFKASYVHSTRRICRLLVTSNNSDQNCKEFLSVKQIELPMFTHAFSLARNFDYPFSVGMIESIGWVEDICQLYREER